MMKPRWVIPAVLFIFVFCGQAFGRNLEVAEVNGRLAVANRILVRPTHGIDNSALVAGLAESGLHVTRVSDLGAGRMSASAAISEKITPRYMLVEIPAGMNPAQAVSYARTLPGVDAASPDYLHHPFFTPDDPYFLEKQPNLRQTGVERVWNLTLGDPSVLVAVMDTGYRSGDLSDSAIHIEPGYDFFNDDSDTNDFFGHGTLVANVIAQATDNGIGCAGMAPNVTIIPIKVFPDIEGAAPDSDIIDGIVFAMNLGVDIINMSFGGGELDPILVDTLDEAADAGILLISATGNDGDDEVACPACYESVLAVGACGKHDFGGYPLRSAFSNYGDEIDLVAPGENIVQESYTAESGVGYYRAQGTSLSAPHVSAAAALMMSLVGKDDPDAILNAIIETARKDEPGWDEMLGWGELDVTAAVEKLYGDLPNGAPQAKISAEPSGGQAPLKIRFTGKNSTDPDGNIVLYQWDFDNGEKLEGANYEITYESPGTYQVVLTTEDAEGLTDTDSIEILVSKQSASDTKEEEEGGCGCSVGNSANHTGSKGPLLLLVLITLVGLATRRR